MQEQDFFGLDIEKPQGKAVDGFSIRETAKIKPNRINKNRTYRTNTTYKTYKINPFKRFATVFSFVYLLSVFAPVVQARGLPQASAFPQGVIVVNTNQAYYEPGDIVTVEMGSLDSKGHTLCDSNLELKMVGEDGKIKTFTTNNTTSPQPSP